MPIIVPHLIVRAMLLQAMGPGSAHPYPDLQVFAPSLPEGTTDCPKAAVTISVRGGDLPLYGPIVSPSFLVIAWAENAKAATKLMLSVLSVLHDCGDIEVQTVDGIARVTWGKAESWPQDVVDSETGWDTSIGFVTLGMILQ